MKRERYVWDREARELVSAEEYYADALVIATEWPLFRKLDLERARKVMSCPIMFDGRNLFDVLGCAQR